METNFGRILTRSQRRLSVESSDTRDEDNVSNVGTPSKKSRVTRRLSSKLEDVPEMGVSSPLKISPAANNALEINSPAKSSRGKRSLTITTATDSPKSGNVRRSQRHSPVDFEKSPSQVANSVGLEDTETLSQGKMSSPNKTILMKKDILTALNTFDSPKPKKNQKEKVGSLEAANPRRSRRLSTELNIVQEDPIREEEVDPVAVKSASKPRRGKRLSTAPSQPTLPEEVEDSEETNVDKLNESIIKKKLLTSPDCLVNVTDMGYVRSPNISLIDISIIDNKSKNASVKSFDFTTLESEANKSMNKSSASPKKLNESSNLKESEQSKKMHKSLELNDISASSLSNTTKSGNKSMSALDKIKSRDTSGENSGSLNISSKSLKEYPLRKRFDKSGNLSSSDTMFLNSDKTGPNTEDETAVDINLSKKKEKSTKLSDTSQHSELSLSSANLSTKSTRRSANSAAAHISPKKSIYESITITNVKNNSSISNNDASLSNVSQKSTRKSNANVIEHENISSKDVLNISEALHRANVSQSNLSLRSTRKSNVNTSQNTTPKNSSNAGALDNSQHSIEDESNSPKKNNRKSAKDFFAQDTPNIDSKSKLSLSSSKNKMKIIIDIATSTPNTLNKEGAQKPLLHKPSIINLSKKDDSFDMNSSKCSNTEVSKTKTEKNTSKLIEDLHMSVTEYAPTPAKNSDKVSKNDKQVFQESEDSEDSIKLTFLDSASEAESDYRSGDSMNESEREEIEDNEIVEKGESLRSESIETEHESYLKDSFICSDDTDNDLLSANGDDLSSGDDELTQSKSSKAKYNLKQAKKQKEMSREMFEARHSSEYKSNSKSNTSCNSKKNYEKIINNSNQSSDSERDGSNSPMKKIDDRSPRNNSIIRDPLSTTVCLDDSKADLKKNLTGINRSDSSDDSDEEMPTSQNKSTLSMNETRINKTADRLSTTVINLDNSEKSVHLKNEKQNSTTNEQCDADSHDDDSLSSLSEGEEIKNITSIYEKQLEELRKVNLPVKSNESSTSADEQSDAEENIFTLKSPNSIRQLSKTEKSLNLSAEKSLQLGNSFGDKTKRAKSPKASTNLVVEEMHELNSDTSRILNTTNPKDLSATISEGGIVKIMNSSKRDKRNSLNKSSIGDDVVKIDSPKLQSSFCNAPIATEMNSKSPKGSKQNKKLSKSLNSSKSNIVEGTEDMEVIGESKERHPKTNESIVKRLSMKDDTTSPHQKNQTSPGITNLASLFKSLPESSLKLFSDDENSSKNKDHIARATTDFKVEQTKTTHTTGNIRKRKNRDEDLTSTWTNTAGDFEVVKKMKQQYPSRPITASDSGCTTSFSVVSLVKHPKQILKVDNQLESKFSNFKNDMLYGKRVKREQSTNLYQVQQKLNWKKKENFF